MADHSSEVAVEWYRLAYRLTRSEALSPPVASRVFGYMGVALNESLVPGMPSHRSLSGLVTGFWDTKYLHIYIRPVTFIQEHIGPDWMPLPNTPPFPEYISGHSVQTAAAATEAAISRLYGGIHFRPAIEVGMVQGKLIGEAVVALKLRN